jgi:hypothetical protein
MIPVNVTVQFMREGVKNSATMRLSMDVTVDEAANGIVQYLALPPVGDYLLLRQRQVLDPTKRLFEAGVQEGDILQLTVIDANTTLAMPGLGRSFAGGVLSRLGGRTSDEPLPVQAALVAPDGRKLWLRRARAMIGRADQTLGFPAESLDVELTDFDPDRTVSRPHALIVYADGSFTVRDLYSQSGVLVNGSRVSPSQAQPIYDGDVLTFGSVALRFRCDT